MQILRDSDRAERCTCEGFSIDKGYVRGASLRRFHDDNFISRLSARSIERTADDLVEAKNFSDQALIRIFAVYFQCAQTERILIEYIIEHTHTHAHTFSMQLENILSWEDSPRTLCASRAYCISCRRDYLSIRDETRTKMAVTYETVHR